MTSPETESFATCLSAEEAERVRKALDQTGLSKSDLLARGFRYYLDEYPDEIPAFRTEELGPLSKAGILPPFPQSDWDGIDE